MYSTNSNKQLYCHAFSPNFLFYSYLYKKVYCKQYSVLPKQQYHKPHISSISWLHLEARSSWVWWCTHVIPALGRLNKEDWEFQVSLGYRVRSCLKKKKEEKDKRPCLVISLDHLVLVCDVCTMRSLNDAFFGKACCHLVKHNCLRQWLKAEPRLVKHW
jgi:hypothetical protein